MAKQVIINVKANTSNAISELDQTKAEIKKLNAEVNKVGDKSPKEFKKLETGSKKTGDSVKKTTLTFRGLGTALKGLGIGLIIAAFATLQELFQRNQRVSDIFKTSFEALSIAFNDFVGFVDKGIESITSFFKDPLEPIKNFGKTITDFVIGRIELAVEGIGLLGSAIKKVFQGDFKGALEDAGKGFVSFNRGVNPAAMVIEGLSKTVVEGTKAISNYTKSTIEQAKSNVELKKSAELAAVANQGLIEKFDRQAEQLRQVRDDERLSIEERKKANDELAEILEEQEKLMLRNAQVALDAALVELQKDKDNIESKKAVMEAENELAAVQAQIEGFRSEQKSNDLALDRELIEMTNSKLEAETNLSIEQKRFNAEQIKDNLQRLEKQKEIDQQEQELQQTRLQKIIDEANVGTQAKIDAQIALDEFMEQSRQQNITREKEISEQEKIILDARLNAQIGFAQAVGNVVGALGGLLQEGTNASKAAALAEIIIKTGVGFAQGLDIAQKTAAGTGPAAAFAFPIFYASQIAAVLSTVSQAKQILSKVKGGGASLGGDISGGGRGVSTPTPQAPSFNIVGASAENQLAQTLADATQKPIKAFVVAGDVSTAQSLDRNIIQESSLG
jgi:hypothetical protein